MPSNGVLRWLRLALSCVSLCTIVACGEVTGESTEVEADAAVPLLAGTLEARVLDGVDVSEVQYRMSIDGERVKLLFADDPHLRSGAEIEVWGTWQDEQTIAVTSFAWRAKEKRTDAPLKRTAKHHRVAILAMQEATVTEQDALRSANGDASSLRHFMAETTHGIDTFSADVFRRYRVAYTQTDCLYDNSQRLWDLMVDAFRRDGNNPDAFDHIAVIVPRSCGSDWSGAWAMIGGIRNDGGVSFQQISVYKDDAFDPWYLAHELGHNLGMNHSQSIHCGQTLYKANATGCTVEEYGNYNDPMGWGEGVYWGTPHQRFMGWIDADEVVTAGRSGTFNLQPADDVTCGIRALRIPIPSEAGHYFYVEYRRARSSSLYAGTGRVGGTRSSTVLITRSRDGVGNDSYNQRVDLRTSVYEGARVGQRYDLGSGVVVELVSMAGAARVKVTMPGSAVHRRDDGTTEAVAADGTVGPATCSVVPPDGCPNDPNKTEPGVCGCGVPEGTCGGTGGTGVRYEAEARSAQSGCAQSNVHAGFTGTGFMDFGGNGTWIEWNAIQASSAGSYELTFRYANGGSANRSAAVLVNGASVGSVAFAPTGAWTTWRANTAVVTLRAGANTLRVQASSGSGGPNVDHVVVTARALTDQCPNDPNKIAPGTCGCGVADTDGDRDGTLDCKDGCATDAAKTTPGICGCGVAEGTCTKASIRLDKPTFAVGEAIVVQYANLPGNALDWIGTYVVGAANTSYQQYLYTNGTKSGTLRFNGLPKGKYEARLFYDDSYQMQASVPFEVVAP